MTYTYEATIARIIDGDTLTATIDLGFHVWLYDRTIRLNGCNAREIHDPGGIEARDNLATLLPPGTPVTLTSIGIDKYGDRIDARIALPDGADLTQQLITTGWAAPWDGHGPKPTPPWPRPEGVS